MANKSDLMESTGSLLEVLTARQKHKMKPGTVKDEKKLVKDRKIRHALVQMMVRNGPPS